MMEDAPYTGDRVTYLEWRGTIDRVDTPRRKNFWATFPDAGEGGTTILFSYRHDGEWRAVSAPADMPGCISGWPRIVTWLEDGLTPLRNKELTRQG
jgi:hypothetical protein